MSAPRVSLRILSEFDRRVRPGEEIDRQALTGHRCSLQRLYQNRPNGPPGSLGALPLWPLVFSLEPCAGAARARVDGWTHRALRCVGVDVGLFKFELVLPRLRLLRFKAFTSVHTTIP